MGQIVTVYINNKAQKKRKGFVDFHNDLHLHFKGKQENEAFKDRTKLNSNSNSNGPLPLSQKDLLPKIPTF